MTMIEGVLRWVAPLGVAALLFSLTARLGPAVFRPILAYVGVVVLGLALHMFVVYSLSVRFFGGMSPREFFRGVRVAMLTAFSTASSNATLPTALKVAEENLQLPPHVARFVLTAGSAMNQNGTALFEGVTVLFLAQFYGVELDLVRQVVIMGICVLGGIGTAGVPAGSLPVVAMILGMVGIPPEGIGAHPRRRPLPRHVPHHAQRHRRPRRRGLRRARRARIRAGRGGLSRRDRSRIMAAAD